MNYSFFDLKTGLLTGQFYSGDDPTQMLTPGVGMVEGIHDHLSKRVELGSGSVVNYRPPPPADTEDASHKWDSGAARWVPIATLAANKKALCAAVVAEQYNAEQAQARAVRETLLLSGLQRDAALERLKVLEKRATSMREILRRIAACNTQAELDAVKR